jgi:hypothetical protein
MENQFIADPRGEYSRICPYCLEVFIANHLTRIYCPVKNGIKNFCKYRHKRLIQKLNENGAEIVSKNNSKAPLKIIIDKHPKINETIDQKIKTSIIDKNYRILKQLIGQKSVITIDCKIFITKGFETEFYDYSEKSTSENIVYVIGHLAYVFKQNEIIIFIKSEI